MEIGAKNTEKCQACGASYKFADGGNHTGATLSHVKLEEDISPPDK